MDNLQQQIKHINSVEGVQMCDKPSHPLILQQRFSTFKLGVLVFVCRFYVMVLVFCDEVSVLLAVVGAILSQSGFGKGLLKLLLALSRSRMRVDLQLTAFALCRLNPCVQFLHMTCSLQSNVRAMAKLKVSYVGQNPETLDPALPIMQLKSLFFPLCALLVVIAVFPTFRWVSRMI